jgi:beta-lactamase superfamily II metal-dependent hydrolase
VSKIRIVRIAALFVACVFLPASPNARAQQSGWRSGTRSVVIDVLDVGQGDSILVRSPEGKTLLIDAGPTKDGALKVLKKKGIASIDLVAISHHHSDHYGGMDQVIRAYKPRYFVASHSGHTTKLYLKLLQTVEAQGMTAVQPTAKPRKIELGSVELTIFPQPPEDKKEENNNSIGMRLKYGTFAMLLTGDSEETERQWWLKHDPSLVRDCTILKLAHHGSHNGTDARWLRIVRPELAVASLGKDNSYGHPHSETVSLLLDNQIPLLRTDQLGTITIQSDGRDWSIVRPELVRRGHPTQDDVDRVAATTVDEAPARTTRSRGTTRTR